MPAQTGNNVLLAYGNQGTQQSGAALVLNYNAPTASGTTMVWNTTLGRWVKSQTTRKPLDSRYVAVARKDIERAANWVPAQEKEVERTSPWVRTVKHDGSRDNPWGAFGEMGNGTRTGKWATSARKDDQRSSLWSIFGEMMNEDRGGRWPTSAPADAFRKGVFGSHWIPTYVPIPYVRPDGTLANFIVVGGSPMVMQVPGTLANMYLPLHAQFGAELYTPHFLGDPLRKYWHPAPSAANFLIDENKSRQLLVDGNGNPILTPSSRDSFKLNPWGAPRKADDETIIKWIKYSRPMNPGWGIVVPSGPVTPPPGQSLIVPVQRVYVVINEVTIQRVSNNTQIPASALSIQFDCDSWLPSFSATIPESAISSVVPNPTPVEIACTVNGYEFRFFVEKISRNRQFAQRSVSISGRGIACELDNPYAPSIQHTNGSSMTAQQLIDAALTNTGYTQTWNITDWLVPANAFSMFGTPAEVAGAVAEASGSVLQADWSLRDLRMIPRYPVKPWDWAGATPDIIIPADVVQTEGIEWFEKPDYNVVYVSGTTAGVVGQVKITGTAGDKPAPMYTNALITHNDAARQKGISILSDTGRKAMMQLSMPVLESTGVIDVCKLIQFNDGATTRRGIVRANNISVNWPTVRQTLTIEAAA